LELAPSKTTLLIPARTVGDGNLWVDGSAPATSAALDLGAGGATQSPLKDKGENAFGVLEEDLLCIVLD
jgi:hypothetical protein